MALRFDPIRNEFIDDELGISPSSKILYGEGAPDDSLGSPGDFYIDTKSYSIHQKSDTWGVAVNLRGADGKDGQAGIAGPIGPMGPVGPAGVPGVNGVDGKDGADGLDGVNGFNGLDGKSVELRAVNQVIEWRQEGGEWANLYSFPSLIGGGGGTSTKWTNVSFSSMATGFVPYTGAAFDVNLGAHNLICAEVLTDTVIAENLYFNSVPYDVMVCTSVTSGQLTNVQMGNNLTFFEGELSVTNAALTRTNDTNVTLTLTGSAGSALLAATNLALGWTGTLAPSRGGTGASTQVTNAICYYDGSKITTSPYATMSFIAGDIDLLITHPSVTGTVYEIVVTSSSCQYVMAYNTASTFQGICGTGATENYWTLSTAGLGLYVSASSLWFGSTSNDDLKLYRNNTERLRLTSTGVYVPDLLSVGSSSLTINAMTSGTSLIQANVKLIVDYNTSSGVNNYFLGSGNDGGLLQVFGCSNTLASPTAITTNGRLGGLFGRGYAATGYSNAVTAIQYYAESTFTDTSTPTYITFSTTASAAITRREVARFDSRGALLFADGLADGIGFRGSLGSYSIQYYNDGSRYPLRFVGASDAGTPRWFEFGNYTSDTYGGTWNAKVSINSVTGYTVAGSTVIGPWPIASTYALFGNSALDLTNAANYSIVVRNNGEFNLNRPSGQPLYVREANGGTSQFTILTGGKVGVGTNSPSALLDVTGFIRSTGNTSTPTSGVGVEILYNVAQGYVQAYDRSTSTFKPLYVEGSTVCLNPTSLGYVVVNGTTASRRLTVQGGSSSNDLMFYLKQSNDYGYSFNLDSFSTGRLWIKGVNNGIETDIMTLDRTNAYVGIGTTAPSWRLVANENAGYSSRAANPLPTQVAVQSGSSGYLRLGNYYTGGVGTCSTIQSTDYYSGADHGCNLLLNPLGGNVGVGEDTPNFAMVARYTGTIAQISARYDGTSPSNHKELQIGYNGSSGGGYGWMQAIHNGSAYTNLVLNLNGGSVTIGTTNANALLNLDRNSSTVPTEIAMANNAYDSTQYQRIGVGNSSFGYSFYMSQNATQSSGNWVGITGGFGGIAKRFGLLANGTDEFSFSRATGVTTGSTITWTNVLRINAGLQIGTPTGGDKGAGTLNVAADIYKNNTAYTNPQWALKHYYTGACDEEGAYAPGFDYQGLMPLDDHRAFTQKHYDLPIMTQLPESGYLGRGELLLGSLEEAYLYIYQLHDRISQLENNTSVH